MLMLMGLFLGLYPKAVCFLPFHLRIVLYSKIHMLLISWEG